MASLTAPLTSSLTGGLSAPLVGFGRDEGEYLVASNRNRVPYTWGATTNFMKFYGITLKAPASTDINQVRVKFTNWYALPTAGIATANLISFKLKAGLEQSVGGTIVPLLFNGVSEVQLDPGDEVWSDPVDLPISAAAIYRLRYQQEHLGVSGSYNQLHSMLLAPGRNDHASSGTDNTVNKVHSGSMSAFGTVTLAYGPSAIIARPATPGGKSVLIIGDSISRSSGDTTSTTQQGDYLSGTSPTAPYINIGNTGWAERSIGAAYPYLNLSVPSRALSTASEANLEEQLAILDTAPPSDCVIMLGVNDLLAGSSAASVLGYIETLISIVKARYPGVLCHVCTLPPVTASSDAWATKANQSFSGTVAGATVTWANFTDNTGTSGRSKVNAEIRAESLTGQDGHFDSSAAVEDATDERYWISASGARTGDGLHPNYLGHTDIAAAVDLAGNL